MSATSVYDDVYKTTDTLIVNYMASSGLCGGDGVPIDVTHNWQEYILDESKWFGSDYSDARSSFQNALLNGQWAVSQHYGNAMIKQNMVKVVWTETKDLYLDWGGASGDSVNAKASNGANLHVLMIRSTCYLPLGERPSAPIAYVSGYTSNNTSTNGAEISNAYSSYGMSNFIFNGDPNYPSEYDGTLARDGSTIDEDQDGLSLMQELQQGTIDNNPDSDGDGISDLKESIWYVDRDDVFCDTGVTPYVCAYPDPTVKDIYVETDWMNSGTESYKPTNTQIGLVESGLSKLGYNVYIDNGQYGGGSEVSEYIDDLSFTPDPLSVDFFDLKNGNSSESISENFSTERQGIWRYLLSGYKYSEKPTSSGASFSGSDNTFISYGLIKDNPTSFGYSDFDTAIAGTIVHELGHSLCLSNSQDYSYQSNDCIYSGIDTSASLNYDSVMNYNLQMFQNNLSDGNNGPGDHADWGAIDNNGIADFADWDISEASSGSSHKLFKGLTIEDAVELHNEDKLGKVKRGNRLYDIRLNKVIDLKTGKISQL